MKPVRELHLGDEASAEAIHTRLHCVEIEPTPARPGRELIHLIAAGGDEVAQGAFIRELQHVQARVATVYTRIYCGLMPPVDMSQAYDALAREQEYVKGSGWICSRVTWFAWSF